MLANPSALIHPGFSHSKAKVPLFLPHLLSGEPSLSQYLCPSLASGKVVSLGRQLPNLQITHLPSSVTTLSQSISCSSSEPSHSSPFPSDKSHVLTLTEKALPDRAPLPYLPDLMSYNLCTLCSPLPPATLASLPFLENTRHSPTSGPLH